MAKYINTDVLEAFGFTDQEGSFSDGVQWLLEYIDTLPSADVQPVRQGRWNCGDDMFEYAVCSYCKWDSGEPWEYAKKYFKFCPHCGTRMEHEQHE